MHTYIQKCSNATTVVFAELTAYNRIFCNAQGLLIKVKGLPEVTRSHHPAKFGCHRFCESVDIKFSFFQETTWSRGLVGGVHLTWVTTLLSFGAILLSDVTSQITLFSRECFFCHYGGQLKTAVQQGTGEKIDWYIYNNKL